MAATFALVHLLTEAGIRLAVALEVTKRIDLDPMEGGSSDDLAGGILRWRDRQVDLATAARTNDLAAQVSELRLTLSRMVEEVPPMPPQRSKKGKERPLNAASAAEAHRLRGTVSGPAKQEVSDVNAAASPPPITPPTDTPARLTT